MNRILVLAEKPSVGRDLARVLGCHQAGAGCLEGEKYVVTWALGHLVSLADPEVYDERYKAWRIEDLPLLPLELKLVVIKQTARQFKLIKELLNRNDIGEVVIATDAGREGELVARWILEKARVRKPLKRLWISSVTDRAIREGFAKLRPGREYENLYAAAVARAEADWLVGINATRALTCKYNAQLSCGRVQTPTLAIIAQREAEINSFKPQTFYGLTAVTGDLKLTWQDSQTKTTRSFAKEYAEKLKEQLQGENARIREVHKTRKKTPAPLLYDLTELQRDANKIYGFSAKETLSVMQGLYEKHKVLTYPRTDSRYLTSDLLATLKDRIDACNIGPYAALAGRLRRKPLPAGGNFVNDNKVSDHHAIIPTEQPALLTALTDRERKIYDLVVKRFLAVLYPPFEYEQITLTARIGAETFLARGKTVLAAGWKEVYGAAAGEDEEPGEDIAEQLLPGVQAGDILPVSRLILTSGQTKPPAPFNEASLLSAMENPVKYMTGESAALKKTIGETGGLGTVATRADIIEKLFNSFLLEKRGQDIFITSKGRQLLNLVPEELKSPTLTAQWEQKLSRIADGQLAKTAFTDEMRHYARLVVGQIMNSQRQFKHDNLTRTKCPECGKYMLAVSGKRGKMLVCQDRECGYRKNLAVVTNARCPNCHKKLALQGEGEGRIFVCSCGYREKLTAFNARKKQAAASPSKREVARFLHNQEQEPAGPFNSALADALNKLKLK